MSSGDCCQVPDARKVDRQDKAALIKRLNRIEGQVRGITRMIEEDRYCVDILTQITAVKSAMNSIALHLLESHADGCVKKAIASGAGEESIAELITLMKRMMSN